MQPSRLLHAAIVVAAALALGGCSALTLEPEARDPRDGNAGWPDPVDFPECRDDSYDFIGEGTLAGLGLDGATPALLPDPERMAMIWVTHEVFPTDAFGPNPALQMTRRLCFQFADGSGGSEWPVHPAWRAPGTGGLRGVPSAIDLPLLPVAVITLLLLIAGSWLAFRRGSAGRS